MSHYFHFSTAAPHWTVFDISRYSCVQYITYISLDFLLYISRYIHTYYSPPTLSSSPSSSTPSPYSSPPRSPPPPSRSPSRSSSPPSSWLFYGQRCVPRSSDRLYLRIGLLVGYAQLVRTSFTQHFAML